MVIFASILFCLLLVSLIGVRIYLSKQAEAFLNISTFYTNQFMDCQITVEEYNTKKTELRSGMNKLLKWYLRKENIIDY